MLSWYDPLNSTSFTCEERNSHAARLEQQREQLRKTLFAKNEIQKQLELAKKIAAREEFESRKNERKKLLQAQTDNLRKNDEELLAVYAKRVGLRRMPDLSISTPIVSVNSSSSSTPAGSFVARGPHEVEDAATPADSEIPIEAPSA